MWIIFLLNIYVRISVKWAHNLSAAILVFHSAMHLVIISFIRARYVSHTIRRLFY